MPNKSLIIADDFTGSNDTGVQLKKNKIDVEVILFPTSETTEHSVVLDTESRTLSPNSAYEKVKSLTSKILENNDFKIVYKKVDSTLRGNIAEEVHAVMEVYHPDLVLIAPAFPKINRITLGGKHYLNNVPLMRTEMAHDPLTPVWTDNIREIFEKEFKENIHTYSINELENTNRLKEGIFHLFDVEKDEDLQKIKELASLTKKKILYVGSAGLAEYLFTTRRLPSLSVVGSISQSSLDQMRYAQEQGFEVVQVLISDLLKEERVEKYSQEVLKKILSGKDTILTVTRKKEDYENTLKLFNKFGISDKMEISRIIKETFAQITEQVLSRCKISKLFMTGGDTAIEVMNRLGAKGCQINRELFTGIVESSLVGGDREGLIIVSKAGAFGDYKALYLSNIS